MLSTFWIGVLHGVLPTIGIAVGAAIGWLVLHLVGLIKNTKMQSYAGQLVQMFQDKYPLTGNGPVKLASAIEAFGAKFGVSKTDADLFIRAAYQKIYGVLVTLAPPKA